VLDVYRRNRPAATPGDLLAALLTDRFFRLPALDVVAARGDSPTWVYEMAWRTSHQDLGAAHAVDLPFVFDALDATGADGLVGDRAPQRLADEMHRAWVDFAVTGRPAWRPYDADRTVMVFDGDGSREVSAPRDDERAAWG
jgi:para-nitrobenzyl esterase